LWREAPFFQARVGGSAVGRKIRNDRNLKTTADLRNRVAVSDLDEIIDIMKKACIPRWSA